MHGSLRGGGGGGDVCRSHRRSASLRAIVQTVYRLKVSPHCSQFGPEKSVVG